MQQNNPYQVKAFTIMEVTITMLVAAIVIGITYTAYTIISRSFIDFKSKNEDIALIARIDHLVKRDFEQADLIVTDESGVSIQKLGLMPVHYEFNPSYIVRRSVVADTFKVNNTDIKTFFEHREKSPNNDSDPSDVAGNRIDELSFTITYKDDLIPFHYVKTYSAVNLLPGNPYAFN